MIDFKNDDIFYNELKNLLNKDNSLDYFCPNENDLVNKTTKFIGIKSIVVTGYSPLVLDDISAYDLFYNNLTKLPRNYCTYDLIKCVQKSVFDYFGYDKPNEIARLNTYRFNYEKDIHTSISNFKNTGNSWCLERATLCHNFLKLLGLNSVLISSNIELNGNKQLHAFNAVEINGNKYLLDLLNTPSSPDKIPEPIFERLPKDINLFNDDNILNLNENLQYNFVSRSGKLYHIEYLLSNENCEVLKN